MVGSNIGRTEPGALDPGNPDPGASSPNGPTPGAGSVGPFEPLALLGKGGTGVVYSARDSRASTTAALKLMAAGDSLRFARELEVLRHVNDPGHPGVVRLLDSDSAPSPTWYAMELLDGDLTPLSGVRPNPGRNVERQRVLDVLTLVERVARALDYVHRRAIVHADLSSRNIRMRASSEPVLCDFGASVRVTGLGQRVNETQRLQSNGTLGYVAPERLRGEAWDSRADLYSLGCIWFELLTGRPVFVADHEHGLLHQHVHDPPGPISQWVAGFDPKLQQLLSRLLAKQARERPATAGSVASALHDYLRGAEESFNAAEVCFEPDRVNVASDAEELTHARMGELLEDVLGVSAETALLDHVYGTTQGNAADAYAYVRWLVAQGAIQISTQRARWTGHALDNAEAFPGLVDESFERLTDDERVAVSAAAIMGKTWTSGELRALLTLHMPGKAAELSQRASELLAARGVAVARDTARFEFRSELQRRALLHAGPKELVHELRAARAEQLAATVDVRVARELGEHWRALAQPLLAARAFRRAARQAELTLDRRIETLLAALTELDRVKEPDARAKSVRTRTLLELVLSHSRAGRHTRVWALAETLLASNPGLSPLDRARTLRAVGLSYRMVGKYALAGENYAASEASLAKRPPRSLAAQRERIELRIQRARLLYVMGESAQMMQLLREVSRDFRHVARGQQRADLYMNLANAIVSERRYAYSRRAVRYQRMSYAWHRAKRGPTSESALLAQFDLAFMLLLGGLVQCRKALALLDAAAIATAQLGETPLGCRIELYRAIALRRLHRVDECRAAAERTFDLAQRYGLLGYQGAAHACLAWVEHRAKRQARAIDLAQQALRLWWRAEPAHRDRRAEYPFQWLAQLPLLLILWEQERYEECTPVIEELLHPTQARLCKPLRNALTVVLSTQRQDWARYARALESALRLARGFGYL